ncbi:MAG: LysR family transcriptional regulator substrate-binding protein [Naasia sp.]
MSEPVDHPPAARERLVVAFVTGVSPDKWSRVWGERMDIPLELIPRELDLSGSAPADGFTGVDMALARFDGPIPDGIHAIPLWNETPVVVTPKDHPASVVDSVSLAELADENILDGTDDDTLDLVAAGVGLARMPQSVFRATGRRDVIARPVSDAEPTRIALAWVGVTDEAMDEFVGIVRGRSAKSSRGAGTDDAPAPKKTAAVKAAAAAARAAKAAAGGKKTPPRPARGFPRGKPGRPGKRR